VHQALRVNRGEPGGGFVRDGPELVGGIAGLARRSARCHRRAPRLPVMLVTSATKTVAAKLEGMASDPI
jgi:hypothetical protein